MHMDLVTRYKLEVALDDCAGDDLSPSIGVSKLNVATVAKSVGKLRDATA